MTSIFALIFLILFSGATIIANHSQKQICLYPKLIEITENEEELAPGITKKVTKDGKIVITNNASSSVYLSDIAGTIWGRGSLGFEARECDK